jgi:YD repeat-containing protein
MRQAVRSRSRIPWQVTRYAYSPKDQVTTVTDALGGQTTLRTTRTGAC